MDINQRYARRDGQDVIRTLERWWVKVNSLGGRLGDRYFVRRGRRGARKVAASRKIAQV
jgi:hypothetical protein